MKCPVCGSSFEPKVAGQKYCSRKCKHDAYGSRSFGVYDGHEGEVLREFECGWCGKHVKVRTTLDRREKYCCGLCKVAAKRRKAYERRIKKRGNNLGMSGGMSLGSLIRRERRVLM